MKISSHIYSNHSFYLAIFILGYETFPVDILSDMFELIKCYGFQILEFVMFMDVSYVLEAN